MIDARTLKVRAFRALRAGRAASACRSSRRRTTARSPTSTRCRRACSTAAARCAASTSTSTSRSRGSSRTSPGDARVRSDRASVIDNASYGRVGADLLHGVVRGLKPRRIVELGSGHSTLFMAAAAERNRAEGVETELRTFDPYPSVARPGLPGLASLEAGPRRRTSRSTSSRRSRTATCCSSTRRTRSSSTPTSTASCSRCSPRWRRACSCTCTTSSCRTSTRGAGTRSPGFHWAEQYLLQAFLAGNPGFEVLRGDVRAVP